MTALMKNYTFFDKLAKLPFVEQIWLFGSRARKDNQDRADIDIAILCPNANHTDWRKISDIIESADTLLKVDCIRFDTLKDQDKIKQNILETRKVIYARD